MDYLGNNVSTAASRATARSIRARPTRSTSVHQSNERYHAPGAASASTSASRRPPTSRTSSGSSTALLRLPRRVECRHPAARRRDAAALQVPRLRWAALFPPGGYLLQTAFFQASVFAVTDLFLTLNLTFHRLEDSFFSVLFGFAWAVGALFYELHQIQGRQTTRSGQSFVEEIKSYVRQDPFNLLDLAALSMAAFAYFCTTIRMLATPSPAPAACEQMAEAAAHFEGLTPTTTSRRWARWRCADGSPAAAADDRA